MKRLLLSFLVLSACTTIPAQSETEMATRDMSALPAAVQAEEALSAKEILSKAHERAGGENFVNPGSLKLSGYNIVRKGDDTVVWDNYAMWREFASSKEDAHQANGKVRIEAWRNDELALFLAFDGEATYNKDGKLESQAANAMWSNSFGFGAIRNALDEGWNQKRVADRQIDGAPSYMVELIDPTGSKTLFGVRQSDFSIVYVGFNTPRGWHERRYSHFFSKPGVAWRQAGRVRLFYDGQKTNEAVWLDFEIGTDFDDVIFSTPPQTSSAKSDNK